MSTRPCSPARSEEHTSDLQSHQYLHSFPTRRSSDLAVSGLCEVLRQELKPRGVTVTVVYPPDVDTPMLAGETLLKPPELRALSNGENALSADQVARALITGTQTGRPRVIPGASTRLLRFASGAVPGLLARYMDNVIARAQRNREIPLA